MKKTCGMCKIEKNVEEFGIKYTKNNNVVYQWQCKSCQSEYRKNHYQQNRKKYINKARKWGSNRRLEVYEYLYSYFQLHPCIDCGETNPIILEFDHLDKKKKTDNVSFLICNGNSLSTLKKEIEKCVVRCSNCHKIKTSIQENWYWNKFLANKATV